MEGTLNAHRAKSSSLSFGFFWGAEDHFCTETLWKLSWKTQPMDELNV